MNVILYIVGGLCILLGWFFGMAAKSSIHEIYGAVVFLIAFVCIGSAGVIGAIHKLQAAITAPERDKYKMDPKNQRQCPECRELVHIDAKRCKHCVAILKSPGDEPASAS